MKYDFDTYVATLLQQIDFCLEKFDELALEPECTPEMNEGICDMMQARAVFNDAFVESRKARGNH